MSLRISNLDMLCLLNPPEHYGGLISIIEVKPAGFTGPYKVESKSTPLIVALSLSRIEHMSSEAKTRCLAEGLVRSVLKAL